MAVYLIAHDIGTSGNKATLFSEDGRMIANTVERYPLYSDGNRAEQDANDWWRAVCTATRELLKKSAVSPDDIAAVSFSGQMMGCLPIDREGRPLRRAIIWADRRADQQVAQIREKMDDAHFFSIAGHRNISSYGMQKAMWIQSQEPEVYENTWKFLNAKDYIVLKMTGKCLTDVSDANGMECFDLKALKWSDELVACSGLDGDKLPEIVPSTHAVGHVTAQAAQETGLSEKTMVVMGAGDGVAANVGAGSVTPGNVYCCIGTSAWLAATTEQPLFDPERRMMCWAHAVPGLYSPNGTMQYAGGSYAWLKNTICTAEVEKAEREGISPYQVIEQEIEKAAPGSGGVLFLPYLIGERAPRWNDRAKGVYFGLTADTSRADMLRSVLEGVAMNLDKCVSALRDTMPVRDVTLIGGASSSRIWQQIFADVFRARVHVPDLPGDANSLGAAVIAGVGCGLFPDFRVTERFVQANRTVDFAEERAAVYDGMKEKFDRVYEALIDQF